MQPVNAQDSKNDDDSSASMLCISSSIKTPALPNNTQMTSKAHTQDITLMATQHK
jgi:hypothetical protein